MLVLESGRLRIVEDEGTNEQRGDKKGCPTCDAFIIMLGVIL